MAVALPWLVTDQEICTDVPGIAVAGTPIPATTRSGYGAGVEVAVSVAVLLLSAVPEPLYSAIALLISTVTAKSSWPDPEEPSGSRSADWRTRKSLLARLLRVVES